MRARPLPDLNSAPPQSPAPEPPEPEPAERDWSNNNRFWATGAGAGARADPASSGAARLRRKRDHHNADITSSQPAGLNYKYHVILTLVSRICLIVNITAEISVLNIFMQSLQFNVWNTRSLGEAMAWTRRLQASARPGLGPSPSPGPQSLVCSVASTLLFSTPQVCCIAPPHSSYTSVKTSDFNPHCCGSSLDYKGRVFVILTLSTYQQINRSPTELLSLRTCLQQVWPKPKCYSPTCFVHSKFSSKLVVPPIVIITNITQPRTLATSHGGQEGRCGRRGPGRAPARHQREER